MANLLEISQAIQNLSEPVHETILLYGRAKTGKTRLAATIARLPWVENIYWFDLENGSLTLVNMLKKGELTEEQAKKIILLRIPDTPERPVAYETMTKVITKSQRDWSICVAHGRADCPDCTKTKAPLQSTFNYSKTTKNDFVIIDTLSQLGDSCMSYACRGQEPGFKPGWDEYGFQGRILSDILTVIQQAKFCNFICITHELMAEYEEMGKKKERIYPLVGTKNYSSKVGKYFSHCVYLELETKKHKAGSSTTYKLDVLTGSRTDWKIEAAGELSMDTLYTTLLK